MPMANGGAVSPLGPRTGSPPDQPQPGGTHPPQAPPGGPQGGPPGGPSGPVSGPVPQQPANGPSPMAALMSVTDNLPPGSPRSAGGSPPGPTGPRSASRGSQHSPNSTGTAHSLGTACPPRPGPVTPLSFSLPGQARTGQAGLVSPHSRGC